MIEVKKISGNSILSLFKKGVKPAIHMFVGDDSEPRANLKDWSWRLSLLENNRRVWLGIDLQWDGDSPIGAFNTLEHATECDDISSYEFATHAYTNGHGLANLAKMIAGMIDIHKEQPNAGHRKADEWFWNLYKDLREPDRSTLLINLRISYESDWISSFEEARRRYANR